MERIPRPVECEGYLMDMEYNIQDVNIKSKTDSRYTASFVNELYDKYSKNTETYNKYYKKDYKKFDLQELKDYTDYSKKAEYNEKQ